ncbi:RHS repeat-associated core domain-containing protein [Catelliglobosispora koreensis]|uniref:RHS repeat-associated core domain-containing protein n=1 Tax=Catelliglobosispora koreensis TaxID=129052 RepID=UPI00039B294B|nr:RHS repeat-associated core domain-containing protein [Catelliglobosispora koreensis]
MLKHLRRLAPLILVLPLAVALPAGAQAYQPGSVQREPAVPGSSFKPQGPNTSWGTQFRPAVTKWPSVGKTEVTLPGLRERQLGTDNAVKVAGQPLTITGDPSGITPRRISVETLSATGDGVQMRLSRADGVAVATRIGLSIDYSQFRWAGGGDWASRLSLYVQGQKVAATNDVAKGTVEATMAVGAEPVTVMLAAAPSGSAGDYKATSLSPSATWGAAGNSGDFNWSYGLRVPPGLGGPEPAIGFDYSSASVDGRMASANNQSSLVGEGFTFNPGHIERRYNSCAEDMGTGANNTTKTGDLCWETDNASLTLSGHSGELLKDAANANRWFLRSDDGTYIERKTGGPNSDNNGEWWLVRTTDGTQYWFGGRSGSSATLTVPVYGNHSGEPCHGSSYAASYCTQGYRWLLDYVVDTTGNTMSYTYVKETNKYGRNLRPEDDTVYDRDGYLQKIEYGTRTDSTGNAPMQVVFDVADRCLADCTVNDAAHWPDVPWDQVCTAATCGLNQVSPTFFTTKRLAAVITKIWAGLAYTDVEKWTLSHSFPSSDQPSLWLAKISHTGLVGGSASVPDVTFQGTSLPNRVDTNSDQFPAMTRYRMKAITTETGGRIDVTYTSAGCVKGTRMPDQNNLHANNLRCYPVKWTPEGLTSPINDFFHRYLVSDVAEAEMSGRSPRVLTHYDYLGEPGWHYTDDDGLIKSAYKTWSVWRGYSAVRVTKGDPGQQTVQERRFFRGMHGDKLPTGTRSVQVPGIALGGVPAADDEDAYAGMLRETISFNGPGNEVSALATEPWQSAVKATRTINGSTVSARVAQTIAQHTRTTLDGGRAPRTTTERMTYDEYGMRVQAEDRGDNAVTGDEKCALTTYARNVNLWIMDLPARERTFAVDCTKALSGTGLTDDDVLDDLRYTYDAPTGNLLKSEKLKAFNDGNPAYLVENTATYDSYGRVLESVDIRGNKTVTAYTPSTGGPLTAMTSKSPLGWETTTQFEPAWGVEVSTTDPNGRKVESTFDPLGRMTQTWFAGRDKKTQTANVIHEYHVRHDAPSVTVTKRLGPSGDYIASYAFQDGLLRDIQTQQPNAGEGTGAVVTETFYDSAGRAHKTHDPYVAEVGPSTSLFVAHGNIPSLNVKLFDSAGRTIADVKKKDGPPASEGGTELWRTSYAHFGDREETSPPSGGTKVTSVLDAGDRVVEKRQHHKSGTGFEKTAYQYNRKDQLISLTDPAGLKWEYTYDLRGRQVKVTDPDRGTITNVYNDYDEIESTRDSREVTIAYTYDTIGRKRTVRDGSVTGPVRAEWTYDVLSNGLAVRGRLVKTTRYEGTAAFSTEYTSFTAGYLAGAVTHTIPATPSTTGVSGKYTYVFSYKPDGSPETVRLPAAGNLGSETLRFDYGKTGLPSTLSTTLGATYVTGTEYTSFGELGAMHLRNSTDVNAPRVDVTRAYNLHTRRLEQIQTKRSGALDPVSDLRYSYDPAGNVTGIADVATGDSQCFTSDHLRRLKDAWTPADGDCLKDPATAVLGGPAPYRHTYTNDGVGNRTRLEEFAPVARTTDYTIKPGTHQVSGAGSAAYTYDPAGNMLTRPAPGGGTQTMTWDAEGHLATSTDTTGTTSYIYDADGSRLIRNDPTGTTLYLPDQEVRSTNGVSAASCSRYYTHAGQTLATRTAAGVVWLSGDHHGTANISIEAGNAQTTAIRRETPFGVSRAGAGTWPSSMDKGFVGGTADNTGLVHLEAREYDPSIGRFISVDPVLDKDDPQQLQGYSYANNSPVSASDPDGLWPDFDFIAEGIEFTAEIAGLPAVVEGVKTTADWVWNNADKVSAATGAESAICMELIVCAPFAPWLGMMSFQFGVIATVKSCVEGKTLDCQVGIISSAISFVGLFFGFGGAGALFPRLAAAIDKAEWTDAFVKGLGIGMTAIGSTWSFLFPNKSMHECALIPASCFMPPPPKPLTKGIVARSGGGLGPAAGAGVGGKVYRPASANDKRKTPAKAHDKRKPGSKAGGGGSGGQQHRGGKAKRAGGKVNRAGGLNQFRKRHGR